jgi:hypothetical protein
MQQSSNLLQTAPLFIGFPQSRSILSIQELFVMGSIIVIAHEADVSFHILTDLLDVTSRQQHLHQLPNLVDW